MSPARLLLDCSDHRHSAPKCGDLIELVRDNLRAGHDKLAVRCAYLVTALGGQLPNAMIAPLQSAIAHCSSDELSSMWDEASNWASAASVGLPVHASDGPITD